MADICNVCLKSLKNVKVKVLCSDCNKSFHGKCVNLSADDVNYLSDQGDVWRCTPCSQLRRKSMVLESKSTVTYDDIFKLVNELKEDIKRVETSLGTSLNSCHEELAETKKIVQDQKEEITKLVETINELRGENNGLRKQISDLQLRVDEAEQYSRRNTIEIHGVPVQKGENVVTIVKDIGRSLGFPVNDSMIDACHRLRSKVGSGRHPGIIVRMVRRLDAEELLQKRRVKRNFNTHDIGLTAKPAEPVYLNECLSPARRTLFSAARKVKNEKNYSYLWVRGGKIFLRKEQGLSVITVTKMEDLEKL
ncbi:uncharacterized protein LOC120350214 [Nilaparvata lugens]|uniref:uncharacterized protein LOC120350214 n=1 Tax=Nilaparvata lugens TaxID=108931 RepID=UPI00193E1CAC|nr:uncharacterized protein LOC120350214 [Nilaparvata lugens]